MLEAMDRVVMVAPDAGPVGAAWERFLDARPDGSDTRPALGARAYYWRVGDGRLEVLVPSGVGIVSEALETRGPHLFAGGFVTADLEAFAAHLDGQGIRPLWDGERVMLDEASTGIQGLRLMVDRQQALPPVGLIDTFYELTDLVADAAGETARAARVLGLDTSAFEPISSEPYGYEGTLTLLSAERLDRLEMITPNRSDTTMDRYYRRIGGGLYMAFSESGELDEIERRLAEAQAGFTAVPAAGKRDDQGAHTVFLHPAALGGMMLGVSRRNYAWTWSGRPERAASP